MFFYALSASNRCFATSHLSVPLCPGHTARFAFVSLLTRFAVIRALLSPPIGTHPHLSHLQERMFYFYHAFCSLKNEQPRTTNHAFLDRSFLAPYFQFVLKNVFYMIRGIGQRGKPYLGGITESHCSCKNNAWPSIHQVWLAVGSHQLGSGCAHINGVNHHSNHLVEAYQTYHNNQSKRIKNSLCCKTTTSTTKSCKSIKQNKNKKRTQTGPHFLLK